MLNNKDGHQPASNVEIREYLEKLFSTCMNVSKEELDEGESFFSLGLTSIIHAEVHCRLSKVASNLSSTVLFEYPNLKLLTSFLANKQISSVLYDSNVSDVGN